MDDGVEDFRFEESAGGGGEMGEEKLFSEKQVSRGGDGDKFREALDQAEDDSEQPIRHGFWSEMKVREVPVKASAATLSVRRRLLRALRF